MEVIREANSQFEYFYLNQLFNYNAKPNTLLQRQPMNRTLMKNTILIDIQQNFS